MYDFVDLPIGFITEDGGKRRDESTRNCSKLSFVCSSLPTSSGPPTDEQSQSDVLTWMVLSLLLLLLEVQVFIFAAEISQL